MSKFTRSRKPTIKLQNDLVFAPFNGQLFKAFVKVLASKYYRIWYIDDNYERDIHESLLSKASLSDSQVVSASTEPLPDLAETNVASTAPLPDLVETNDQ